jgi:hypothetical protein
MYIHIHFLSPSHTHTLSFPSHSRTIVSELGIYPAVDPLDSTSRMLDPRVIGDKHYETARKTQLILQNYKGLQVRTYIHVYIYICVCVSELIGTLPMYSYTLPTHYTITTLQGYHCHSGHGRAVRG